MRSASPSLAAGVPPPLTPTSQPTFNFLAPQDCTTGTGTCDPGERQPGLWEFPLWAVQDADGGVIGTMDPVVSAPPQLCGGQGDAPWGRSFPSLRCAGAPLSCILACIQRHCTWFQATAAAPTPAALAWRVNGSLT